ncbi:MAG: MBL fold metallo-hydrolase [Archaeoglobaceae archaeon]|nr:MBL fold metallo-hydrolase [Archaeoglobaceae archaeon]MDW7989110.1 MBL fold metallo-hydrolase [Archaeoglobaceae archaeon]
MKVTILSDNKILVPRGYKAEWGFSVLIEGKETILFDTGSGVVFENFASMQKPMPSVIVLSHGHYDHTSGIRHFLQRKIKLYTHPDTFLPRFFEGRFVGIPYQKEFISTSVEIFEQREPVEIKKNVWVLGEIPRVYETAFLKDSFLIREGKKEIDEVKDDQAIAIKTERGITLILGCCHSGLRNTLKWAEEVVGDEVKEIIGGTHLISYDEKKIIEILKSLKIDLIVPMHCTGLKAEMIIEKIMGENYRAAGVGDEIEV